MWQKADFSQPIFLLFLLASICCWSPFPCYYASDDQTPRLPNVAAQLNSRGVDFFGSIGHKLVTKELPKTQFPTISLPIDSGPGSGEVDVTQLQIPANIFQSPKFNFKLQPPRGIHFVSAGGSLPVKGLWNASYELIGIKFYTSGWVQLLAEDIRSTLVLGVSHLKDKPQLEVFDCSADVSRLEVHIGGGVIPWLVNLFRNALAAALRETIHEQFCLSVQETLLDQLNDLLLSLPTFFQIGDRLFLNYSFDNDTQVTNTFVQSFVYADLLLQNDTECPLGPASPMSLAEPSRDQEWMLSSWLHGSVFNCLLWSLHRANMLQLTFDPNFDGGKFAKFLQTNCRFFQLCLGRFFPLLAEQYPNQHVDFHFHSASPPTAQLVPSPSEQQQNASLNLTAPFFVDLHISPWANHPELLARLEMNSTAALSLALDDGRLKGNLSSLEIRFTEVSSSIGSFSDKFLHSFSLLVQPLLEAVLQSALRPGFPLPAVDGIQLAKGSRLTALVDSQQLRVDADLEYVNRTALRLRQRLWHRRGGRSRVYVKKERSYHSVI